MIPLSYSESLKKFPRFIFFFLCLVLILNIGLRLFFNFSQILELTSWSSWPESLSSQSLALWALGFILHENIFSLVVFLIYAWALLPKLFEDRGVVWPLLHSLWIPLLSIFIYDRYFDHLGGRILFHSAFMAALLGQFMRREIWGNVTTLVFGPGLFRVYDVPCYVHLFFWFFYLMLSNFFMEDTYANAPMIYFAPFVSFLLGFIVESLFLLFVRMKKANS